jgi:hypothetical protein
MCLPVSRLFWVSSLAYPNLLGTKGYVVVVVVVVTRWQTWKIEHKIVVLGKQKYIFRCMEIAVPFVYEFKLLRVGF